MSVPMHWLALSFKPTLHLSLSLTRARMMQRAVGAAMGTWREAAAVARGQRLGEKSMESLMSPTFYILLELFLL